ncbi:MAG: Gx transporter family protein [Candidatus Pelethousia sp.]|nr:Gx transporter family protein [Candidatus Pelethousia sp.]
MDEKPLEKNPKASGAKRIALLGMLFALAMVLSVVEGFIPVPVPVPGVRLGLANIVVMFALLQLGWRDALGLTLLKAGFVAITRGAVAGALSLAGGAFAFCVMALVLALARDKTTYLLLSVAGAVFHNVGQLLTASLILGTFLWPYFPILLLSGIVTGFATSVLLKLTAPAFGRLHLK